MMRDRKTAGTAAIAVALVLACAAPGGAQEWPSRTIKLVVPFGPGGPTDVAARLVTQIVQKELGATIVVENHPGAGGATGSKSVANAEPDGYTLLVGTSATLAVVPALMKNPGYDAVKSFAAVAKVADSTTVMIVPVGLPVHSLAEFIAYAKAHPGKLSYASAGAGNQTQLVAELLKAKAGFEATHVPYKSGAEMVTAVLSEQVQMSFPDISILLSLIREHKVRALAVTSAQRHPQLPDVPTIAESGFPDFAITFWSGVVAPAATPAAIIGKLNAAIGAGLRSQEIRDKLAAIGAQTASGSPQDFARFIADESVKWRKIAQTAGVALE